MMMRSARLVLWRLRKDAAYWWGVLELRLANRVLERATDDRAEFAVTTRVTGGDPESIVEIGSSDTLTLTRREVTTGSPAFVADPFLLWRDGSWHLFVEVFDRRLGRGVIGLATRVTNSRWTWRGTVLQEPFHLSYPCVFEADGRVWMVPETGQASAVRLYVADDFPHGWRHHADLLQLPHCRDATIFAHDGLWWCFVETSSSLGHDQLRLFVAERFDDPESWQEHPLSPIVDGDAVRARPAGKPMMIDGALHRLSQDCGRRYGMAVRAHRIHELSTTTYREHERGRIVLFPGCFGWNRNGAHHLDAAKMPDGSGWLVAADGW